MQIIITSLSNPRWENIEHTAINCKITTSEFGTEVLPFTASQNDVEAYGREIFADIVAGKYGPIAPYTAPPSPTATQNKEKAVSKLAATDWVNEPDVYDPANTPHLINRDVFLAYRAQIRVIAVTPIGGDLDWPTEPTAVWA
jgi:hypothetical protein